MNPKTVFFSSTLLLLAAVLVYVDGQSLDPDGGDAVTNFQPSLAVVIGILSIMFSLTFLLLLYAKFCHRRGGASSLRAHPDDVAARSASGIDKSVVKSLPFFRFSALRGSREGLECAVCLSRFEDVEVLRLLPKCKHAFHVDCVDRWLERHSSCPLCRRRVSADDAAVFSGSESLRFLADVDGDEDPNVELFVRREEDRFGSSRFSVGSSFRTIGIEKGIENRQENTIRDRDRDDREDRRLLFEKGIENSQEISISIRDHQDREDRRLLFGQEFGPSEVVFKNRWSNVSSSDLMFLESEMINDASARRFSELGSSSNSNSNSNPRSVSDITAISRFGGRRSKSRAAGESCLGHENVRETNARKIWLPIAKKTVEWFADREKKSQLQEFKNTNQEPKTLLV